RVGLEPRIPDLDLAGLYRHGVAQVDAVRPDVDPVVVVLGETAHAEAADHPGRGLDRRMVGERARQSHGDLRGAALVVERVAQLVERDDVEMVTRPLQEGARGTARQTWHGHGPS